MSKILKITSIIFVLTLMFSLIAIPTLATLNYVYLNSTTSWETNDYTRGIEDIKIRVLFSYTDGNGDIVYYFASARSNSGNYSDVGGLHTTATNLSVTGNWADASYEEDLPFCEWYNGYAYYD